MTHKRTTALHLKPCRGADDDAGTVIAMVGKTGVVRIDGARLREARLKAGYPNQADLAKALGWAGGGPISAYERGRRDPTVYVLTRIADVLEVDIEALLAPDTPRTLEILRIRTGYTQAQFAAQISMSRALWAAIETGRRKLLPSHVGKVADALDVDPAAVYTAAGTTPTTATMVVPIPEDIAARVEAVRAPGQPWIDALRGLLRDET